MKEKVKLAGLMSEVIAEARSSPEISEPQRASRSHTTIYLDPRVLREICQTALDLGLKPHDLLIEGVNLMLREHGGRPSIDDLLKG